MDRTVSSVKQWASTLVTTGEPQCVVPRKRALHTDVLPLPQANRFTATAPSSSSKRQRLDDRKKFAVDIGAGSATFCVEFLEANPNGYALAIDIIEPKFFGDTFRYICSLGYSTIERSMMIFSIKAYWDVCLLDIIRMSTTPM